MSAIEIDATTGEVVTRPLTPGEVAAREAAEAAAAAARAAEEAEEVAQSTVRALVVQTAQSAVGANLTALTANQRNALIAILLYKAGGLNADGTIRNLSLWAR